VLGIRHSIPDNVLQKDLQNATSLLIDQTADTLHSSTTSETTNSGLGDALDVIAQHLAMTLGATLAKALPSLSTPRHGENNRDTPNAARRKLEKQQS
jgi:hypothetical protein